MSELKELISLCRTIEADESRRSGLDVIPQYLFSHDIEAEFVHEMLNALAPDFGWKIEGPRRSKGRLRQVWAHDIRDLSSVYSIEVGIYGLGHGRCAANLYISLYREGAPRPHVIKAMKKNQTILNEVRSAGSKFFVVWSRGFCGNDGVPAVSDPVSRLRIIRTWLRQILKDELPKVIKTVGSIEKK